MEISGEDSVELGQLEMVGKIIDGLEGFLTGSVDKSNMTDNQRLVTSLLYAINDSMSPFMGTEGFIDTAKDWIMKVIEWIKKAIQTIKGWFTGEKAKKDADNLKGGKEVAKAVPAAIAKSEHKDEPVPQNVFDNIIKLMKANGVEEEYINRLSKETSVGPFATVVGKIVEARYEKAIKDAQSRNEQLSLLNKIDSEVGKLASESKTGLTEAEATNLKARTQKLKEEFAAVEEDIKKQEKETNFLTNTAQGILRMAQGAKIINDSNKAFPELKMFTPAEWKKQQDDFNAFMKDKNSKLVL